MKTTKKWIFLLLLASQGAHADLWTGNKLTDSLWITMNTGFALDWMQTRYIADHPEQFAEKNTDLGLHPTTGEVNRYFLSYALGVNALYFFAPEKWKPYISSIYIIPRYDAVNRNYEGGVRFEF